MTNTNLIQNETRKWLQDTHSPYSYCCNLEDLTEVTLDGVFNMEDFATIMYELGKRTALDAVVKEMKFEIKRVEDATGYSNEEKGRAIVAVEKVLSIINTIKQNQ